MAGERGAHSLRVLHAISSLGGGGAERQLGMLAAEQARAGHEVHIATLRRRDMPSPFAGSGVTVHFIDALGNHDVRIAFRLLGLMRTLRPDVVQTWLPQMDVFAGSAARLAGAPWVLSERSAPENYPRSLKNLLRRLLARGARAIVANSREGERYWRGVPARTALSVIPNAVAAAPSDDVAPALEELPLDGARPLLLFAGRLAKEKNLQVLVAALATVVRSTQANASVCGDGPERAWLVAEIERRGLGAHVRVLGHRADLWRFLRRANLFVSVSLYEGRPNTVLEAMASRCPIVASDIPAHRELLDERSAWLVPSSDPGAVASAIMEALGASEEARRRAEAAYEKVQDFTIEAMARRYDDVYRSVVLKTQMTRGG